MSVAGFFDRLLTVAVTATVTSAGWVVFGGHLTGAEPAPPPPEQSPQAQAAQVPPGALQIPVQGVTAAQLVDAFADPREQGQRPHEAIDIPAPLGTPVSAAGAGTVEKLFQSDAGGLTVYVRSPDRRWIHYYAHLQAYAPGLAEGQQVRAGQAIGTVGFSGNADPAAPHLHFAVSRTAPEANWWDPAQPVNPYPLLQRQ